MTMIEQSLKMLGLKATDKVTRFEGVVSSVSFDAYGCVQAAITPPARDGKLGEGHWFDVKRLELGDRVMEAPRFSDTAMGDEIGAAEKPAPRS
jgi:hypothetical protein